VLLRRYRPERPIAAGLGPLCGRRQPEEIISQTEWDEDCLILLQAARSTSIAQGHQGVVHSGHLLFVILTNFRPDHLLIGPKWLDLPGARSEIAPPGFGEGVVPPDGQTPAAKRVLERAAELASKSGRAVGLDHLWSALQECEGEMVAVMLAKLGFVAPPYIKDTR
jgi:hypothetical protein